ncbi:8770_t:CDS:2, partial [Funneliformis geosporum]
MLTWIRDNLKDLKPVIFYKKFAYSHTSRKQAEEKLRELLTAIKDERNTVNRKKAKSLLDNFEPWTQSIDCEKYWLDVETSLGRLAHEASGRISAYNTIKNFTRKINDEEEALNEFQPPSKRVKNDDLEQQRTPNRQTYPPETSGEARHRVFNISVNQDHDDEPGSNSPLHDEFVKEMYVADETEKDYSDTTEFFTKSARKLDSDEEISSVNQDQEPESRSPIHEEFVKEMYVSSDTSDIEETKVAKSARKLDSGEETSSVSPTKRMKLNEDTDGLNESANFDYGLRNYEEGIIVDSELALQETDEESVPTSERLFNEDTWKKWTLKSSSVVADLLDKFARKKGHPLRPEAWRIVRCGFKIAKPKWCSNEDYSEIQRYTRRATISSRTETISRLQRQ